jgi:hypothetical protein
MNRRDALKSLTALAGATVFTALPTASAPRYGAVTVGRHRVLCSQGVFLHVFHKGRDVTDRCSFADDTGEGIADLFIHNAAGRVHWDKGTHGAAREIVHGVTLREGAPPKWMREGAAI